MEGWGICYISFPDHNSICITNLRGLWSTELSSQQLCTFTGALPCTHQLSIIVKWNKLISYLKIFFLQSSLLGNTGYVPENRSRPPMPGYAQALCAHMQTLCYGFVPRFAKQTKKTQLIITCHYAQTRSFGFVVGTRKIQPSKAQQRSQFGLRVHLPPNHAHLPDTRCHMPCQERGKWR